jgi:hypothetical protein
VAAPRPLGLGPRHNWGISFLTFKSVQFSDGTRTFSIRNQISRLHFGRFTEDKTTSPGHWLSSKFGLFRGIRSLTMPAWTLQLRGLVNVSRSCHLHNLERSLLQRCTAHQIRSFSLESLTTPFNRKELRAAASGTPDLSSQYHLVYVGTLARRIATYKIGAFILSVCGLAVAPIVVATAQVPLMALPGFLPQVPLH